MYKITVDDIKKNILYIGNFEMPNKDAASHRVIGIAKALRDNGMDVYFVGVDKENKYTDIRLSKKKIENFFYYSREYPRNSVQWIKYASSIGDYIDVINDIGNVDAIICYNLTSLLLIRVRNYCKRNSIKCIGDVTEWYPAAGRGIVAGIIKAIDEFWRMRILQKNLDALFVISSFLNEYYSGKIKVMQIPPLVDLKEEKWNHDCVNKPRNVMKIVYAGSPGKKDRIDLLVGAIPYVKRDLEVNIVGITKDEYVGLYPAHIELLKYYSNINFRGRVSHDVALQYIKESNYSCFFRKVERFAKAGFPTKFVESVSCGTCVITNNTSDLKLYCKDTGTIMIADLNPQNIARTIDELGNSPNLKCDLFDYRNYISKVRMLF